MIRSSFISFGDDVGTVDEGATVCAWCEVLSFANGGVDAVAVVEGPDSEGADGRTGGGRTCVLRTAGWCAGTNVVRKGWKSCSAGG